VDNPEQVAPLIKLILAFCGCINHLKKVGIILSPLDQMYLPYPIFLTTR